MMHSIYAEAEQMGEHFDDQLRRKRIAAGSLGLAMWFVTFSGGLLVETSDFRALLAPRQNIELAALDDVWRAKAGVPATESAAVLPPHFNGNGMEKVKAFLISMFLFAPTNLALLALTAGLIGGCASNVLLTQYSDEWADQPALTPRSYAYLSERPWCAMVRAFIVYLCIIAGLYIAMDDPFKTSTPSQYCRLAGLLSVISLLVGYDPSRLMAWIGIIPGPHGKAPDGRSIVIERGNLEFERSEVHLAPAAEAQKGVKRPPRQNGPPIKTADSG